MQHWPGFPALPLIFHDRGAGNMPKPKAKPKIKKYKYDFMATEVDTSLTGESKYLKTEIDGKNKFFWIKKHECELQYLGSQKYVVIMSHQLARAKGLL